MTAAFGGLPFGGVQVCENAHLLAVEEVLSMASVDPAVGLSSVEAAARLSKYGPNELSTKKKRTLWQKIYDQVANVLVGILLVVAIISLVQGITAHSSEEKLTSFIEVGLILGIVSLNTWIGVKQEGAAAKSAEALVGMLSSAAVVLRDGEFKEIPARELVVGDIVKLSLGEKVPADLRLLRVRNLAAQEAALTGESLAVEKRTEPIVPAVEGQQVPLGDRKNMCFSATLVAQGEGSGVVVNSGDTTEIGNINELVSATESKKTDMQLQLDQLSSWIAVFVVIMFIIALLYSLLVNQLTALAAINFSLIIAVAMIPEGLAALVTMCYAHAVGNMARKNAIVRVLPAVETLGSVTVICSDKTGTLTMNVMSLVSVVTSSGTFQVDTTFSQRTPATFRRNDAYMSAAPSGGAEAEHDHQHGASKPEHAAAKPEHAAAKPEHAAAAVGISSLAAIPADTTSNGTASAGPATVSASASAAPDAAFPADGGSPSAEYVRSLLAGGVLCSQAVLGRDGGRDGELGNPTELAILRAVYFSGADPAAMRQAQPAINDVPFSSEYKFMATIHAAGAPDGVSGAGGLVMHVKGALDRLLPLCKDQARGGRVDEPEPLEAEFWLRQSESMSGHGLRVLALARAVLPAGAVSPDSKLDASFVRRDGSRYLTLVGLCCILDPPRPECVDAIAVAHRAGVRVAMITGDHRNTALAIGGMLGIVDAQHPGGVTGPEMDAMDDAQLRVAVMRYNVFARASPENKIRIVKALQAEGQVASMTGDGVNDAPALKAADMGVAMGKEGTDVARESAEMILADDNFATIVAAIQEGRTVWDNLRKVLLFNQPVNNAQGLTIFLGLVFGMEYAPLGPIQVLYANLICAVTLGVVLAVEPSEASVMDHPPRRVGKRIVGRYLLYRMVYATVVLLSFTLGSVYWLRAEGVDQNVPIADLPPLNQTTPCNTANQITANGTVYCCKDLTQPAKGSTVCPNEYGRGLVRSLAMNTLVLSCISLMFSARFSHKTALHPRVLYGNKYTWYSAALTTALQLLITYVPGLNNDVFSMSPMPAYYWGICVLFVVATLLALEAEKMFVIVAFKRRKTARLARTQDEPTKKDSAPLLRQAEPTKKDSAS